MQNRVLIYFFFYLLCMYEKPFFTQTSFALKDLLIFFFYLKFSDCKFVITVFFHGLPRQIFTSTLQLIFFSAYKKCYTNICVRTFTNIIRFLSCKLKLNPTQNKQNLAQRNMLIHAYKSVT